MTEIDRLQQAMLDGLKAKAAAEFWEDAHDRVEDRMLELEAEVDSLRRRLHELGEEADRQYEILAALREPSEALIDAVIQFGFSHFHGMPMQPASFLRAAVAAAEQEVANEVR